MENLTCKTPESDFSVRERAEEGEESESMNSVNFSTDVSEDENITSDNDEEEAEQLDSNTGSEQEENRCEREESKMKEEGMTQFGGNVDEVVKKKARLSVDEGLDT